MWHEHGGASSIFNSGGSGHGHGSTSPTSGTNDASYALSPKRAKPKKHHSKINSMKSKRSTINYLQNSALQHASNLRKAQNSQAQNVPQNHKPFQKHRPAQIITNPDRAFHSSSLESAIQKVAAFKKRRAPIRLNPMESLVSQPQPQSDPKDVGIGTKIRGLSLAKQTAKKKVSEFRVKRSEVQTPEVMGYMKKMWEDEGGLKFYEHEHEHENNGGGNFNSDNISVETVQANNILDSWVRSFELEQDSYDSISVFAEVRLKEALASTEELISWGDRKNSWDDKHSQGPSPIRAALCCDLLRKISTMFGRYKPVMETLTSELLLCIYEDYPSVISGGTHVDARTLFRCSPYFTSLKNCKLHRDELMDELQVYNDGVDLRKALVKCSVGVKTMFNDARRAIRDMIFKVWAAYVRGRTKKAKKLKLRVQLNVWFKMWKGRYLRWKEHGYFYDSESDNESVVSDLEMVGQEDQRGSMRGMMAMRVNGMKAIAEDADSSYEKLKERMQQANSPAMSHTSGSSDGTRSPSPTQTLNQHSYNKHKTAMGKFKSIGRKTLMIKNASGALPPKNGGHGHRTLKIIKELTEASGRIIMQCERRRCHVELTSISCQTDPVTITDLGEASASAGAGAASNSKEAPNTPKDNQASLKSVLGGKKEKPMSVENAMTLVPSIYEQYLTMLANPGPDTIGKHLNMVTFTKNSLIRKYGLKNVAMKQFRALGALLQTKKALKISRLRVFASLYGLPTVHGGEALPYSVEYVDFFFKNILEHTFLDPKHCNAILAAKGRSDLDKDQLIDRMEMIFPHFQKKDGFKFMMLEQKVDGMTANVVKGIDMVDADDVVEVMIPFWKQEDLLSLLTWKKNRAFRNFQQSIRARRRRLKKEHDMEHRLEDKFVERFGDADFYVESQEELDEFCQSIGVFAGKHTMEEMLKHMKEFEKRREKGVLKKGTAEKSDGSHIGM
ncbi:hypothetical protein TrLO_g12544 [Triparma laevis f. longispina]|uniref:Uncharacterized protein n=1 Tax=Triparma laevis f. longispina TaxID=1714387 RepID=A0A9W6ZTM7_9STRA|nr:hypothetical protein TrLO_g12544 [Triparma laevis f. longispina]